LGEFITPLQANDMVQLITFDLDVNIFPPIKIKSEDTKDAVIKMIQGIKADGQATFTSLMLKKLFIEAKKINADYPNYYVSAVVLSDGYDWPPQGQRKIDIKDYVSKDEKSSMKDWFVHYIALGVLDKKVGEDLKKLAPKTKLKKIEISDIKDKKELPTEVKKIDQEVEKKIIQEEEAKPLIWLNPVAIILYIILIGGITYFFIWRQKKLVMVGTLAYWNNSKEKEEATVIDFLNHKKSKFAIGREKSNNLYLSDFSSKIPLIIKAQMKNSFIVMVLDWKGKNRRLLKFHTQSRKDRLSDGDLFSLGNYSFRYNL
jgi:hypothetical protein